MNDEDMSDNNLKDGEGNSEMEQDDKRTDHIFESVRKDNDAKSEDMGWNRYPI